MAANLNDGNGALSRDELKQWTVAQLSSFLRDRGVVISADGGRKEQLVEKVYYAKQLGLLTCEITKLLWLRAPVCLPIKGRDKHNI